MNQQSKLSDLYLRSIKNIKRKNVYFKNIKSKLRKKKKKK